MARFAKQQIRIYLLPEYRVDADYEIVVALSKGTVAYHPTLEKGFKRVRGCWTVTHIKSGVCFARLLSRSDARALADDLASLLPDTGRWGEISLPAFLPMAVCNEVYALLNDYPQAGVQLGPPHY